MIGHAVLKLFGASVFLLLLSFNYTLSVKPPTFNEFSVQPITDSVLLLPLSFQHYSKSLCTTQTELTSHFTITVAVTVTVIDLRCVTGRGEAVFRSRNATPSQRDFTSFHHCTTPPPERDFPLYYVIKIK